MRSLITKPSLLLLTSLLALAACVRQDDDSSEPPRSTIEAPTETGPDVTETAVNETPSTSSIPPTTQAGAEPAVLTVWVDGPRGLVLEELRDQFEAATGVVLEIERRSLEEILVGVLEPADGDAAPDVFIGTHTWLPELANAGLLLPVPGLADLEADLLAVGRGAFERDGTSFALPLSAEAVAMVWNQDLVESAPGDFAAIPARCSAVEPARGCVGLAAGDPETAAYHAYGFAVSAGGPIFADGPDGGDILLESGIAGMEAGLSALADLVGGGVVTPLSYEESRERFMDGELPFWITGPWELGPLGDSGIAWSVSSLPDLDGNPLRPLVSVLGVFIHADADPSPAAQALLVDHLATSSGMRALHDVDPRVPMYRPVLEDVRGTAAGEAFLESVVGGDMLAGRVEMEPVWDPLGGAVLDVIEGRSQPGRALQGVIDALAGLTD